MRRRGVVLRPWVIVLPHPQAFGRRLIVELNRNHYFMAGLVVLLLGIQFRMVDSYVLNSRATSYLMEIKGKVSDEGVSQPRILPAMGASPRKVIHPPAWLGWAMMSVGGVLVLQSLAMPKPAT